MIISQNFSNDLRSKDTHLFPLVIIGNMVGNQLQNNINLCVKPHNFIINGEEQFARPILLNVPSINENIDIVKKRHKISSTTITISNSPYNQKRFSDIVTKKSLINKECRIYWASPTTDRVYWEGGDAPGDRDLLQIYYGKIRNYSQKSDDIISITIEDLSQNILDKKLPLPENYLDDNEAIPERNRNRPIPMCYGEVDKSPLIMGAGKKLYLDSSPIRGIVEGTQSVFSEPLEGLYMYVDGIYASVSSEVGEDLGTLEYEGETEAVDEVKFTSSILQRQWLQKEHVIELVMTPLPINNILQCRLYYPPSSIGLYVAGENILEEEDIRLITDGNLETGYDFNVNHTSNTETEVESGGVFIAPDSSGDDSGERVVATSGFRIVIGTKPPLSETNNIRIKRIKMNGKKLPRPGRIGEQSGNEILTVYPEINSDIQLNLQTLYHYRNPLTLQDMAEELNGESLVDLFGFPQYYEGGDYAEDSSAEHVDNNADVEYSSYLSTFGTDENITSSPGERMLGILFYDRAGLANDAEENEYSISFMFRMFDEDVSSSSNVRMISTLGGRISDITIRSIADITDITNKNFYANLRGRELHESNTRNRLAYYILKDIIVEQLGYSGSIDYRSPVDPNSNFPIPGDPGFDGGRYCIDFTINKSIEAKRLVQNINAVTPYITRFDNMGRLRFDIIKPAYAITDGEEIKADSVISYSYSRTSMDDVKSRVVFRYKVDYETDELKEQETFGIGDLVDITSYVSDEAIAELVNSVVDGVYPTYDLIPSWLGEALGFMQNQLAFGGEVQDYDAALALQNEYNLHMENNPDNNLFAFFINFYTIPYYQSTVIPHIITAAQSQLIYELTGQPYGEIPVLSSYDPSYYDLEDADKAEIEIDDDRGKYIRKKETAELFAKRYLYFHCNQHLVIDCELPLSEGLKYDISDIVRFDKVLGNTLPYGIDYSKNKFHGTAPAYHVGDIINGQQVFCQFMVVGVSRSLKSVKLKLIQMHNLEDVPVPYDETYGPMANDVYDNAPLNNPMNQGRVEYTFSDGSELHPIYLYDEGLCGIPNLEGQPPMWRDDNYEERYDWRVGAENDPYTSSQINGGITEGPVEYANAVDTGEHVYFAFQQYNDAVMYFDYSERNKQWFNIPGQITIYISQSPGNINGGCVATYQIEAPTLELVKLTLSDDLDRTQSIHIPKETYESYGNPYWPLNRNYEDECIARFDLDHQTYATSNMIATHIRITLLLNGVPYESDTYNNYYEMSVNYGSIDDINAHETFLFPGWFTPEAQLNNQWSLKLEYDIEWGINEGEGEGGTGRNREYLYFRTIDIAYFGMGWGSSGEDDYEPTSQLLFTGGNFRKIDTGTAWVNPNKLVFTINDREVHMPHPDPEIDELITEEQFEMLMSGLTVEGIEPLNTPVLVNIVLDIDYTGLAESSYGSFEADPEGRHKAGLMLFEQSFEQYGGENRSYEISDYDIFVSGEWAYMYIVWPFLDDPNLWDGPKIMPGPGWNTNHPDWTNGAEFVQIKVYTESIVHDPPGLYGDLNGDGIINVLDIIVLINITLGVTSPTDEADLNGDGIINVLDIVTLINLVL